MQEMKLVVNDQREEEISPWQPFRSMEDGLFEVVRSTGPGLTDRQANRILQMLSVPNFDIAKLTKSLQAHKKFAATLPQFEVKHFTVNQAVEVDRKKKRRARRVGKPLSEGPHFKKIELGHRTLKSILGRLFANPKIK